MLVGRRKCGISYHGSLALHIPILPVSIHVHDVARQATFLRGPRAAHAEAGFRCKRRRGGRGDDAHWEACEAARREQCDCCGDVSTHKQWHETVQGSGAVHAVGGQCEECFAVWDDAFYWMAWDGFCAQVAQNEAFRGVVKLARAARAFGQPRYPQQALE